MSTADTVVYAPADSPVRSSRVLRALLRLVMPLTDLVVAIVGFVVCVVGLTLSVGLLPAFLLGVPVFLVVAWLCRRMASLERRRMRLFLGVEIPSVPGPVKGWRGQFAHGPTWRAIGYFLVHFVLGVFTFSIVVSSWGAAGAMLSMPWWLHRVPSRRADAGFLTVTDQRTAWILAAAGLAGHRRRRAADLRPDEPGRRSWRGRCSARPRVTSSVRSTSCATAAAAWWIRWTPSAGVSNATCTTARSSGWWPSR